MFSANASLDTLTKDELRIRAKREANEARRLRLLDARRRVIGLDVAGLNEQVAEKQRAQADKNEIDRLERLRMLEMERLLAAAAEEEVKMREFQKRELKKSWDDAVQHKGSRPKSPQYNPDSSGPAAAQVFQGEDRQYWERVDNQREQMRRWIQEQVAEKAYLKERERQEDAEHAELQKYYDSVRGQAEEEEKEMRKYLKTTLKKDNDILAESQRKKRESSMNQFNGLSQEEISRATSLNLVDERAENAMDSTGRIARKDLFKGYTDAQIRRLWRENDRVRQERRAMQEKERENDREWVLQQEAVNKAMEFAAYEEKCVREAMTAQQLQTLKDQMREQQSKREADKANKFGSVGAQFFSNFGTSCR